MNNAYEYILFSLNVNVLVALEFSESTKRQRISFEDDPFCPRSLPKTNRRRADRNG